MSLVHNQSVIEDSQIDLCSSPGVIDHGQPVHYMDYNVSGRIGETVAQTVVHSTVVQPSTYFIDSYQWPACW